MAIGDFVFEERVGGDLVPVDLDGVSWGWVIDGEEQGDKAVQAA